MTKFKVTVTIKGQTERITLSNHNSFQAASKMATRAVNTLGYSTAHIEPLNPSVS